MSIPLKFVLFLAATVLCVRLATAFLTTKRVRLQNSNATQLTAANNPYQGLRDQALHLRREKIGIAVPPTPTEPWAALMEWGVDNGSATVVAIADRTASVYLSSGGGSIGGGPSQDSIRKADQQMVFAAAEFQPQMRLADSYLLPQRGRVTFYALTDAGLFAAGASRDELSSHRHPLSKLGDAAQNIITQYHLIQRSN